MKSLVVAAAVTLAAVGASPAPRGDALFAAGDFSGARAAYARAVAANGGDGAAHLALGTIALYENDDERAVSELTKAVALLPQSQPAKNRLREAKSRLDTSEYAVTMKDGSTVIPFASDVPLPIIRAAINGKPARLVIDTGAAGIDLSEASVKRLGLQARSAGKGVFAGGATADVLETRIPEVAIGSAIVKNIPSNVIPGTMNIGDQEVDGAIGTRFFYHFTATIDYRHHALVLRPKTANTAQIVGQRVPMVFVGDHFLFARASVNGAPAGWYNIDTGGDGFGIQMTKTALNASRISPSVVTETFHGGGGDVPVHKFTAAKVKMGITRSNVPGLYFAGQDQYGIFPFRVDGTITDQFFRPGIVSFDFRGMQLIVQE